MTTVQGVAISIDSNGFFDYTPPNGFEGTDSFQYSIKEISTPYLSSSFNANVLNNEITIKYQEEKSNILINTYIYQYSISLIICNIISNNYVRYYCEKKYCYLRFSINKNNDL